jgi:hypothetical protein
MPGPDLTPPDLVGEWTFERLVDDHRADQRIAVEGTAVFTRRDDATIDWHEHGTMHLPAGDVPVTTLRVLVRDDDATWTVDFADGRGFHGWSVGSELLHDCAPDLYRGRLDAGPRSDDASGRDPAPFAWTMCWAATGPAKDYVIETTYRFSTAV